MDVLGSNNINQILSYLHTNFIRGSNHEPVYNYTLQSGRRQ